MTYFERGCAIHGEVSRREGRNCIERVGQWSCKLKHLNPTTIVITILFGRDLQNQNVVLHM